MRTLFRALVLVSLMLAAFPSALTLADTDILVTTFDDELNEDEDCSLREAIQAANTDAAVDACSAGSGTDIIHLPPGIYVLGIPGAGEDANATGDLDIYSDLTLDGDSASPTVIDGGGIDRVLHILSGTVGLSRLTVQNGHTDEMVGSGGIRNLGTLAIDDGIVRNNTSAFGNGGIFNSGELSLNNTTVSGNSAFSVGGGIFNGGTATLTKSTVSGNTGGGIYNGSGRTLTLNDCVVSDNAGGGLRNDSAGTVVMEIGLISGNSGPGIANSGSLTLNGTTIRDNTGSGGLTNSVEGSAYLSGVTVTGNIAASLMGSGGGGIDNGGTMTLSNSSVTGNSAPAPDPYGGPTGGGGIRNYHALTITNSTISGNSAAFNGGGILNSPGVYGTTLNVSGTTISDNMAAFGGGIFATSAPSTTATLGTSILAGNPSGGDCAGTISSSGYNLIGDTTGCTIGGDITSNITAVDALLGPLADNGGPTQTHALLSGSPAIDAGSPDCPPPSEDQRGQPRPVDGNRDGQAACDIGAFEAGEAPPPPPSPYLRAFPEEDRVDGSDWPADQTVYLGVEGLVFESTADGDGRVEFVLTGFDLRQGDALTMTSGDIVVVHTVKQLFVTGIDPEDQTVVGTVDGAEVVHVFSGTADVSAASDDSGNWMADFSGWGGTVVFPGGCGAAEAWGEGGNSTIVDWCLPVLTAFPENEAVETMLWPAWAQLQLSIDSQGAGGVLELERTVTLPQGDLWSQWVRFDFANEYNLQPGDVVTVTDGVTTRTHVVQDLSVTKVDAGADTVSGTADAGASVQVWPHEFDQTATLEVIAGEDGAWLANFTDLFDLVAGTGGRSRILDGAGNATAVDWAAPNPWFTAFPEGEVVEGWDWPLDSVVHMAIDDPATTETPDFTRDGTVVLAPWGSGQLWLWIDFSGAYDMKPGDIVTLTDGVTERVHVVQDLSIRAANPADNSVGGTAPPDMNVILWSWEDPDGRRLEVPADGLVPWTADFDDVEFDLLPGYHIRAEVWVEGNDTAVDWYIPNPHFTVFPEWEWIDAYEWPDEVPVTASVEGKPECVAVGTSSEGIFNMGFPEGCDVAAGDVVTLTDGAASKALTVTDLAVTWFDLMEGFVGGTGSHDYEVHIWVHGVDASFMITTPDDLGDWGVDFDDVGFDIVPGTGGRAEQVDGDGDSTAIDWAVPLPVQIDIRPWTSLNLVACRATWDLLPVAVLSADGFDATAVDHDTVRFGRTGVEASVATLAGRPLRYARDVNGDGMLDMVYTFRFGDTGFSCADIPLGRHSARVEATLTGWVGDIHLEGRDSLTLFRLLGH